MYKKEVQTCNISKHSRESHTFIDMLPEKIKNFTQAADTAVTIEELDTSIMEYFIKIGVKMYEYRRISSVGALDHKPGRIISHSGFPSFWINYCKNDKLCPHDSIINPVFETNRPFTWDELIGLRDKTAEIEKYKSHVNQLNIGIGLALPIYGAKFSRGIFTIGFNEENTKLNHEKLSLVHWVCQIAHLKFVELTTKKLEPNMSLTNREYEVLKWVALGKSNSCIAQILDISHHTINSYIARIYLKLGVNDRVSASLRAISIGLL